MEEEEERGLESHFIEADQGPEMNLELARQSVAMMVSEVLKHDEAVAKLRRDHADGNISAETLQRALDNQENLGRRLKMHKRIFEMQAEQLERRLNLKD